MKRPSEDIPADLSSLIRIGTIASVDLAQARCTVLYGDPDDIDDDGEAATTPPIRWLSPRAGRTRVWSPPSIGEQVLLLAPDGQLGSAIALTGIVRDAFPPLGNSEAEQIEWSDGARIAYDPVSHELRATLPANGTATIDAPGGIVLRGDVTIEGSVAVSGTVTADEDVIANDISLAEHEHLGVQAGTSQSGPPA